MLKRLQNLLLLVFAVSTLATGCSKNEIPNDIPECVQEKIQAIIDGPAWDPPARCIEYDYLNRTVYYFPQEPFCCNNTSEAFNSNCELVCNPDGGENGLGDGQCPDFYQLASGGVIVWEDSREP